MLNATQMADKIVEELDAAGHFGGQISTYTLTVNTAADNTNYVFEFVFGTATITFTVNSGTGATTSSIATAIRDAINNDTDNDVPGVVPKFVSASVATNVVTIDSTSAGLDFTMTESDANMTLSAKTKAADATAKSDAKDQIEEITTGIIGDALALSLTADQDDYNPTGLDAASLLILTPDASPRNITGIVPNHRMLTIVNASTTNTIQLAHESGSSAAANQFSLEGATSFVIAARNAALLVYDSSNSKWRLVR